MTNGMHVYGWTISSKVATTDWDDRRKDGARSQGRTQGESTRFRGNRDISTSRDVKRRGFHHATSNSERSYAEVVYDHKKLDQHSDFKKADKSIVMSWLERKEEREWLSRCAIGTLSVFCNYDSARNRLKARGFSFKTSYLGDNHILWCFETQLDRDGFLANRFFWEDCFSAMTKWNVSFIPKYKLVWIVCNEIPLFCWNSNFFLKIGGLVGEPLLVEADTVLKNRLDRGKVLVMKDPSLKVPQVVNVQTDHGTFLVSLSEDGNLVEMAWINQHLGILNEDLNLNPPAENADSLEELETVTVQKVKGKKGGAGHVRKVDRDKSLNLDLQSNHRAWTRGEVREERGGSQNFSDVRKEKNLKEAYSLKTPEKGKGSWVRKSKVKPLGFCVNNAKLVIGKSRSDLGRGATDEDSSWTSSEAESGEVRKGCDTQWKGECSKNVGLSQEAHEVSKEGPTSEFLHDNLYLEDPQAQPQIMESPSEGGTSGLAVNNLEGQMVIYVKETQLHSSMSSDDDSTQMEDRISPVSGDVLAACGEVSKVVNRPGKKNQAMIMRERNPVKIHNMQTRSAKKGSSSKKAVDGEWIATKVSWNLDNEMARIVEESVARGINLNNRDSSRDKEPWFVEEEVTKVIEVGAALGVDFNGKEQEMIDILLSREREDEDKLRN
ncbi:hypothetical protein Q3G72_019617 [Acer saccharum]|nr:hypothetical protein Q3G72_019617 [Acer saccharum]